VDSAHHLRQLLFAFSLQAVELFTRRPLLASVDGGCFSVAGEQEQREEQLVEVADLVTVFRLVVGSQGVEPVFGCRVDTLQVALAPGKVIAGTAFFAVDGIELQQRRFASCQFGFQCGDERAQQVGRFAEQVFAVSHGLAEHFAQPLRFGHRLRAGQGGTKIAVRFVKAHGFRQGRVAEQLFEAQKAGVGKECGQAHGLSLWCLIGCRRRRVESLAPAPSLPGGVRRPPS
jgi:hypothetical protein